MTNQNLPLMPKATAVWLVENTPLTFKQIGDFCGMHELEIQAVADGEAAQGIIGVNPIINGQLLKETLDKCIANPNARLTLAPRAEEFSKAQNKRKKETKYTPIARRQDKPDAIYWLLKNVPNIQDAQITKLIGTTKSTIESIREKSHWNIKNIKPRDPVLLGLCSQTELDKIIEKAALTESGQQAVIK